MQVVRAQAAHGGKMRMPRPKLIALIMCYYLASTVTSVLTKKILDTFARPITVAFVQQLFACAGGLVRLGSVRDALAEWRAALPVAMTFTRVVLPEFCRPTSVSSISCLKNRLRSQSSIVSTNCWSIDAIQLTGAAVRLLQSDDSKYLLESSTR